jgi:hypothetical protein
VRVRILKRPTPNDCDLKGFDVSHFEIGHVYEVGARLWELLVVCGYAEPELRRDHAADKPAKRKSP